MSDWSDLTARLLEGIKTCDPVYRPTNFWTPGVRQLLDDLEVRGVNTFKSWPSAGWWFYPRYGNGFTNATIKQTFDHAMSVNPAAQLPWMTSALNGSMEARRDFDAARLFWDQLRWPFELDGYGEDRLGGQPQRYPMGRTDGIGWGRPYLNYLLCLAALSRHVDEPPTRFLEIGGGFGVLGEIMMQRYPRIQYVNVDIPPLLTVASYYLTTLFGRERVLIYDDAVPDAGKIKIPHSACLPNWRLPDVSGPFDVFVNSFSFQEMEHDVVEHYVKCVVDKDISYVLSLNSKAGKPKATEDREGGVIEQVRSSTIIEMFEQYGYKLCGRYQEPLIISAGELAVLRRSD